MITFVVDEEKLSPGRGAPGLFNEFSEFGILIERLRQDGVAILKHSRIWEASVCGGLQLFQVLFTPGYLDEDLRRLLHRTFDSLPNCDVRAAVMSAREYALELLGVNEACALAVIPCHAKEEKINGTVLCSIGSGAGALKFYRTAIVLGNFPENEFIDNGARAFPNLYFKPGIVSQISKFSEPYLPQMRKKLSHALADLNDHLPAILAVARLPSEIEKRFGALSQFSISPESPKTRKNKAAMKERDVLFGNQTVTCEWHLKFSPTRDRIHVHFGVASIAGSKILIGIFCDHLTT